MLNYRKIYEQYYGPIPKDADGRTYEVHHIDGDHDNNSPNNLKSVTIQEHYDIHYAQGDWAACSSINLRMNKTPEEISETCRALALKRISDGTHNFQNRPDGTNLQTDRVAAGLHHFQSRPDGTSLSSDRVKEGSCHLLRRLDGTSQASDQVAAGIHNFLGGSIQRKTAERGHNFFQTNNPMKKGTKRGAYKRKICPYCYKEGAGGTMNRYHFDNCRLKPGK